MNRRDFLTTMTAAALLTAANPLQGAAKDRRTLMVIELAGGNDGLNTFIPYKDANYRKLRPSLAIADGIPVTDRVALHPSLKELKPILESDRLAVIQNVSYPNPNLSHFRSKDIWQSAHPTGSTNTGWLARYLEINKAKSADAIFLGEEYPLALTGASTERFLQLSPRLAVRSTGKLGQAIQAIYATPQSIPLAEQVRRTVLESEAAVKQIAQEVKQRSANHGYAKTPIGQQFALAGRLLESSPRVLYITIGGWDTHAGQAQRHARLLEQLSLGLAALNRDLQARGKDKDVLILIQSEFGRRPAQNGSGGTDHGTTGPVLLLGPVKPGFYGGDPSLDSLEKGNLPVKVDFRSIYAEILQRWERQDPKPVLGASFNFVGVLT
ncbi:DUF1501 domain-containing protein [Pseudanabaena sp. PCC 6802]|uniref:DUF1501 domain-containing protein n=1 Tax=Pseudanabaena sp. PCC 6802 TaxID=118173 RepID=UPI000563B2B3|nr:DUF1501 domain-containing protein [Pseudanabaena sp. PCC 6802]